jgi:hypothetical protein
MVYFRAIRKYRQEGRPIIYVDETYLHSSHTTPHERADESTAGVKLTCLKANVSLSFMEVTD